MSNNGSGEPVHMRSLTRALAYHINKVHVSRGKLGPKIRPPALLDKSEWVFKGGFYDTYQNLFAGLFNQYAYHTI